MHRPSFDVDCDRVIPVVNRVRKAQSAKPDEPKKTDFATANGISKRDMPTSRSFKPPALAKRSKSNTTKPTSEVSTTSQASKPKDAAQRPASMLFKSTSTGQSSDQFARFKETKQLRSVLYKSNSRPNKPSKAAKTRKKLPASIIVIDDSLDELPASSDPDMDHLLQNAVAAANETGDISSA